MKKRKHIPGQIESAYFDKLPQRCKEMFFEFLSCEFCWDGDKAFFVDVGSFDFEECKSPIEKIFGFAFEIITFISGSPLDRIFIYPQEDIYINNKHYIADFYFDTELCLGDEYKDNFNPLKLVIECDGHDTHNATKAQVKRGNERDYDLKMAGYDVLHFSGSQIFNEPFECAKQTYNFISARIKKG